MNDKIEQTKFNAISAKLLHAKRKRQFENLNNIISFLTIVGPLLFIIAQYITKGTDSEYFINLISFIVSIVFIGLAVLSLILHVTDKIAIHEMGIKDNNYVANECDNANSLNDGDLKWFFRYAAEIDNRDKSTFTNISEKIRKKVYREALKELIPGCYTITCPICNTSPWKYKKGDCQLCGNTTQNKENTTC